MTCRKSKALKTLCFFSQLVVLFHFPLILMLLVFFTTSQLSLNTKAALAFFVAEEFISVFVQINFLYEHNIVYFG